MTMRDGAHLDGLRLGDHLAAWVVAGGLFLLLMLS